MEGTFLIQALVFLTAAVVLVPLAKRIGLGSVLGYLIAGILIGPFVLGFIGEEGDELMHFAEFGVVMMLFLIGLELEPALLWRLRTPILGLGGLQVVLTTVAIGGIAYWAGQAWNQSLAIGMTMALSSTAIVLQTLNEKGLFGTHAGQSSFAVLLFQDIAVIPMLAILPLLVLPGAAHLPVGEEHGGGHFTDDLGAGLKTLLVLGAVGLVILIGRYAVPPLMRIIARTRLRELFTAFALLLIVGIAQLMVVVGLSPALGTFMAGVVLANSQYRHELEIDIEPFKGLLLGLFFMTVGASINFELIAQNPLLIAECVLGLLAVKVLILFILGRFFKLDFDQNLIFSVGLAQTGEFAFVLLSFIRSEGILPTETVATLLVVVAISMFLTPLLMLVNERFVLPNIGTTEEAAPAAMEPIEEKNRVIVAGFKQFGVVAVRFLRANGIPATVLENDSYRVELLRKMGFSVYYGDATRHDLLAAAGAAEADAIIIGLESSEENLQLVRTVKKHFPHLHMIARSFTYQDTYDLMDEGVLHIFRDTFSNGLNAASHTLKLLGRRAYQVRRHAKRFEQHDLAALKSLAAVRDDEKAYIKSVRVAVEELEELMKGDLIQEDLTRDMGWDAESLVREFGNGEAEG